SLLPESWRGLTDKQLCDRSGISGCAFVHPSGHVGGGSSKDIVLAMALMALAMATAQKALKMFDKTKSRIDKMAVEAKKMADEVLQMTHGDQLQMASEALAKACRALAIMKALDALAKATNILKKVQDKKLKNIRYDGYKKAIMAREMAQEAEKMADEVLQMAHGDQLEKASEALAKACRALAIMKALDALTKATNTLEEIDSNELANICYDGCKKATMAREMAHEAKKMANEVLQMAHGDQLEKAGETQANARSALSMACISQAMMIAFDALKKDAMASKSDCEERDMTELLKARQMAYNVFIKVEMARDHQMKVREKEEVAHKTLEVAQSKTQSKALKEYNKACEASNMAQDMLLGMSDEVVSNAREALGIISPY
ncbi:hypothetical protein LSAT2_014597, partial [Lamellibrachia satsuma]